MPGLGFDYNLEDELQESIELYMECDSFLEMGKELRWQIYHSSSGVLSDDSKMDVFLANQIYSIVSAWRKTYDT